MSFVPTRINTRLRLGIIVFPAVALLFLVLVSIPRCAAQIVATVSDRMVPAANASPTVAAEKGPLTDKERAELLQLIKDLQDRVTKLEAGQAGAARPAASQDATVAAVPGAGTSAPAASDQSTITADTARPIQQEEKYGRYTPNLGFKIADTEYGDMSVSIYTYVRYLNQLGLDSTYTDAFGNVKNIQRRQDVQLTKLQIKFLGWVLSPKLRYFLYAWTSNANQGLGAQTVLAGNVQYTFNKYVTVGGGIRSLPGTRSVEGNFPFWTNVDSRHIADEFFRPSYTSGLWAMGNLAKRVKYIAMMGNNMSTLGVPASRIDNGFNTFSGSLVWFPTGDFEKNFSDQGWGDFEHHDKFSTRVGFHYTRSDENKESQPNAEQFENTQLRLSDGTVIFTPDIFGPGVTITDARYQMTSFDAAFKYKGWSLEGEYYMRWLDKFRGTNVAAVPDQFDHGFQLQATKMFIPQKLQGYTGVSKVYGNYGNPYDVRFGTNVFPYKNKVLRWNTEVLYVFKSPVGYTSVSYPVGGRGWIFNSTMELAF